MIYDLIALAGAILVSVGIGLIYVPAGVIALGVSLLVIGVLGARSKAGAERERSANRQTR